MVLEIPLFINLNFSTQGFLHRNTGIKDEPSNTSSQHKIFDYYPGAVLVLCLTLVFWGFLAILILPVQEAYIKTEQLTPHVLFAGLITVTAMIIANFWIVPLFLVALLFAFEKISTTEGADRLRQRKRMIYTINTVLLLFTGMSYALSALFWPLYLLA